MSYCAVICSLGKHLQALSRVLSCDSKSGQLRDARYIEIAKIL